MRALALTAMVLTPAVALAQFSPPPLAAVAVTGLGLNGAGQIVPQFANGVTGAAVTPLLAGDAAGTTAATTVAVQRPAYMPTPSVVTNGGTISLPAGFVIYLVSGAGLVATATIRLPPAPVDRQIARIATTSTLTITALTVQDSNGVAVSSVLSLGTFASASFQFQGTAWQRIGS